jgi:hypothetical protein
MFLKPLAKAHHPGRNSSRSSCSFIKVATEIANACGDEAAQSYPQDAFDLCQHFFSRFASTRIIFHMTTSAQQ